MRQWSIDGSANTDSRLPRWFKWLSHTRAPNWLVAFAYQWATRPIRMTVRVLATLFIFAVLTCGAFLARGLFSSMPSDCEECYIFATAITGIYWVLGWIVLMYGLTALWRD